MNKHSKKRNNGYRIPAPILGDFFNSTEVFTFENLKELITRFCIDVNSLYSLKVAIFLRYGEYEQLLDCDVHPSSYHNAQAYFDDAQVFALVKKYPSWPVSLDPELAAKRTFVSCEATCADTNLRFWNHGVNAPWAVNSVLAIAQRNISNILGECPTLESLPFRFGPGASYSVKYNTSALDKLASTLDATSVCYGSSRKFLESCPGWRPTSCVDIVGPPPPREVNLVKGDRLAFVPKTAKTHRPIGINPLLNGVIQKGYGAVIRRKLRPRLDLDNLQDQHRALARQASIDGKLATVDLSSASDTIAYAFVQDLLPNDWFAALHNCRSPMYYIENNWYTYQKFSAMGNGYTFELETLLFYALTLGVCEHLGIDTASVSVYGDDIIIPREGVPLLKQVFSFCGFSINSEKSFVDGPFRESCGGDYFNGMDVRPFFLKDELTFRTLFLMHNFMVRTGWKFRYKKFFRYIRKLLGREVLAFYSSHDPYDDGSLFSEARPVGGYNRIVAFERGRRRNHGVRTHGHAYGLYRLMLRFGESQDSGQHEPWSKTRHYAVSYRLYRHVHF